MCYIWFIVTFVCYTNSPSHLCVLHILHSSLFPAQYSPPRLGFRHALFRVCIPLLHRRVQELHPDQEFHRPSTGGTERGGVGGLSLVMCICVYNVCLCVCMSVNVCKCVLMCVYMCIHGVYVYVCMYVCVYYMCMSACQWCKQGTKGVYTWDFYQWN